MALFLDKSIMAVGRTSLLAGLALGLFSPCAAPARAEKIVNDVAVFAALDKVTARISPLEIKLGETVTFGALKVTPRACNTRPPTEPPVTTAFVEVDEVQLNGKSKRIFTGWMFAQSPGLHGVEHPVFDVWLTNCKTPQVAARPAQPPSQPSPQPSRPRQPQAAPPPSSWAPQPR